MKICVYCFLDLPNENGELCETCGQGVMDRDEFMRTVNLPILRQARVHWDNLEAKFCGSEERKAGRLADFDRVIAEAEKAQSS